jgi:predicted ATPase
VLALLCRYFGIEEGDDKAERREKIQSRLNALDPALSEALPYLLGLLGVQDSPDPLAQMDPRVKRRRTLEAIKGIIFRESLNQPMVIVFEDLHWIDTETQSLLDLLADSIAAARALLLVNYRPEYHHEWTNKSCYSQRRLDPLGGENAVSMLAALLGESAELDALKQLIAGRTGGNPFFIEEIVRALFDEGTLVRNTRAGRLNNGLQVLDQAVARVEQSGERFYEAELFRLKGELLQSSNADAASIKACLYKAIEVARSQSAKSLELRAVMSLGRLLAKQGQRQEARA